VNESHWQNYLQKNEIDPYFVPYTKNNLQENLGEKCLNLGNYNAFLCYHTIIVLGYIVTYLEVLKIYHSWIHPSIILFFLE
jgi:hypothetical protein